MLEIDGQRRAEIGNTLFHHTGSEKIQNNELCSARGFQTMTK